MKLATILGGPRAVTADQEEANRWPRFDKRDERAVSRVLCDGNLSTHPVNRELEVDYVSAKLEALGIHTFLPPAHIERTYFEFIMRCEPQRTGMPLPLLAAALHAERCQAWAPRYALVDQQPFFTEGHFSRIARLLEARPAPRYVPAAPAGLSPRTGPTVVHVMTVAEPPSCRAP